MVRIDIRMIRIPFEWLEPLSNGSNLRSNASNVVRMIRIGIRMITRIPFEWFKFAFEWLEPLSNGSNLHSNASNVVRMIRIYILMLRILFEWFELTFE